MSVRKIFFSHALLFLFSITSVVSFPLLTTVVTQPIAKSSSAIQKETPINIPFLIVGGGIHGVHISAKLIGSGVVNSEEDICIIDNNNELLESWRRRTANTGMKYLRSAAGYHLDLDEESLRGFGRSNAKSIGRKKGRKNNASNRVSENEVLFSSDYERPRLDFFNTHCDSVVRKYNLDQTHTRGFVTDIVPFDEYVEVQVLAMNEGEKIKYHAKHIILALGNDDPAFPDWVDRCDSENGFVKHLLDIDLNEERGNDEESHHSVAIVGGGITACHKALDLTRKLGSSDGKGPSVHLISRHPIKEQQFDTHQDWMMDRTASKRSMEGGGYGLPKRQVMFQNCNCMVERRRIIAKERVPGTVTHAINRGENGLKYAISSGKIGWHLSDVTGKRYVETEDGRIQLELSLSCGYKIQVDQVFLATGFGKRVPGGTLVQNLISSGLPVSEYCGYPIVNGSKYCRCKISS